MLKIHYTVESDIEFLTNILLEGIYDIESNSLLSILAPVYISILHRICHHTSCVLNLSTGDVKMAVAYMPTQWEWK